MVQELGSQFPTTTLTEIGPGAEMDPLPDAADHWRASLVVPFAQIASAIWSQSLGLNVDDPFIGQGTLTRVVSGVTLHPVQP